MLGMITFFGREQIRKFFVVSMPSLRKHNILHLRVLENQNHLNMLFLATGPDGSLMNTGLFIKYLKMQFISPSCATTIDHIL